MEKKKVLIFCARYLPGFKAGGPIRSISNMVEVLSDDFEFYIVTSDRDSGDHVPYPDIKLNQWVKVGNANVFYSSGVRYKKIWNLLNEREYHRLYLNSFFSLKFSVLPHLVNCFKNTKAIATVLAPRGEFSPGALELKAAKKQLFIRLVTITNLYKNVKWQASSDYERDDIRKSMSVGKNNIVVAPNIPKVIGGTSRTNSFSGILKIVYISRITPKKNLMFALEILSKVKCTVEFNIFGLIDDEAYWRRCELMLKDLPPNIKVNYKGSISNNSVFSVLSEHHLFFLPTKGENYGHAIVEALMAGTPVLITDTTPWRGLEIDSVGWDVSLKDKAKYIKVLELLYSNLYNGIYPDADVIQKWILEKIHYDDAVLLNRELFK